ncbi:MAG: sigma-70 family RNA polymerase sigma factor [Gemmatimonadales bacterium]|nr:sigma-70 family RNA polymerase sigma factor [Gemmatimonadales bacterium]
MSEDPSRSDMELVAAYRQGSESAATELVLRHGRALGRYLYAAGADPGEIEDLVQESFFKAFRALSGWRGEASFRGWLFRIGANLRKDQYRRIGGRVTVPIEDHEIADVADPEGEMGANDMEKRLREGLVSLPRLQREVFLLRAQQGMGYEEICAALGTTAGAARVHYHHAVKRLKDLMQ